MNWLTTMKQPLRVAMTTILFVCGLACNATAEEPIATIAVVSNPYITTLPAEQIKDENGSPRGFLAKTAPASMLKTVELVNEIQPDVLVVLGSLTDNMSTIHLLHVFPDRIVVGRKHVGSALYETLTIPSPRG